QYESRIEEKLNSSSIVRRRFQFGRDALRPPCRDMIGAYRQPAIQDYDCVDPGIRQGIDFIVESSAPELRPNTVEGHDDRKIVLQRVTDDISQPRSKLVAEYDRS